MATRTEKKSHNNLNKAATNNNLTLRELIDQQEYSLKKRLPHHLPKRKNDVYVSRKTDFKQQISRCHRLLESGWNEIYIHGLGAAVNRAMNLALTIKSNTGDTLELSANTSTVDLIDDLEPENDELEREVFHRTNSAIHIKLCIKGQKGKPKEITPVAS